MDVRLPETPAAFGVGPELAPVAEAISMDASVTEAVLARMERTDFVALLGQGGDCPDPDRASLLGEIEAYRTGLEEVCGRAARTHDVALLFDAGLRILALMDDSEARLRQLVDVDSVVLAVARDGAIREAWGRLDLNERRRVLRAVVVPVADRATTPGQRGADPVRLARSTWRWLMAREFIAFA